MPQTVDEMSRALERFIDDQVGRPGASVRNLYQMTGGASREAWSFEATYSDAAGSHERRLVLLRTPPAGILDTDRVAEFRVMHALQGTPGVPLPEMLWLDGDGRYLERPFFVMSFVHGESASAPLLEAPPEVKERVVTEFIGIAAALHNVDWRAKGIDVFEVPTTDTAALRQVDHWESVYETNSVECWPIFPYAFAWLRAHAPEAERITIVHGDYRFSLGPNGNFLWDAGGIHAMLDWEMTHLGDPMEDLAWAYRRHWSAEPFVPLDELCRRYEEISGIPVLRENVTWYRLFSEVKLSLIALTGVKAFYGGANRSLRFAAMSRGSGIAENMRLFLDWAEHGGA